LQSASDDFERNRKLTAEDKSYRHREGDEETGKAGGQVAMTKNEINKFKEILEKRRAELSEVLRNREGIAIEKSPDALDEVQRAGERELAIRNLDRESNLLRDVRAALGRIKEGNFGTCLHCDEEISPKRLNAVPWTAYCIRCQEMADRNRDENNEMFDDLLVTAA
jgi:DnaK suppressor protein